MNWFQNSMSDKNGLSEPEFYGDGSGSITSVGEERANLSAVVYL